MPKGIKIPQTIADFLAVESYLNGFGHKKLTKILSEKGIDLSHEGVRRVKNTRRQELEEAINNARKRLKSKNEIEALHTLASLRLIDLIVSNISADVVKHFYNRYLEATLQTLKVLFDSGEDYTGILKNVELVDMFVHHREVDMLESFENKNRTAIDILAEAFKLMSTVELKRKRRSSESVKNLLKNLYEACTKTLDSQISFGLTEKDFFFLMIKGMLGPDEDYLEWVKRKEGSKIDRF